jgi:hypothetical protein
MLDCFATLLKRTTRKFGLTGCPHVNFFAAVAETILRTAKDGERNPAVLERMALLELQISIRL